MTTDHPVTLKQIIQQGQKLDLPDCGRSWSTQTAIKSHSTIKGVGRQYDSTVFVSERQLHVNQF